MKKRSLCLHHHGPQDGPFNGIPATGKKIKVRGMQISKFNSAVQIVEQWGASGEIGIFEQISAMKFPPHLDDTPAVSTPASMSKI